jgi:hypothetical protein
MGGVYVMLNGSPEHLSEQLSLLVFSMIRLYQPLEPVSIWLL